MNRNLKAGFTLIEVLVVLAVIGVLVALLLPAVHQAREAARRMSCASNLRQLGIALNSYHSAHSVFPMGYTAVVQLGADGEAELVGGGYGWGVMLLPFLEQDNLYDATNFKQFRADFPSGGSVADSANWTVYHAKVSAFLCPSDPADRLITLHDDSGAALGTVARGNYVGNFGQGEAAEDEGREGIFYRNSSIRISDVVDGASKTFLVGERSSNLGKTTWFGLFLEAVVRSSFGEEESPVLVLGHTGYYPEVHTPNDPLAHVDDYWSFHGTGAHFLMVDGSVHMIDNSIDARVYAALASRDGYETVGDGDF